VDETALERAKALFLEGNACFASGDFVAAAERFERALELAPGRTSILANLGAARLRAGRHAEAIAVLEQALAREPDDLSSRAHLGSAYAAAGRHADALACHDLVLAAQPGHAASWLARGEALRFLERHDEALAAFERANAIEPALAGAWTQRGNILREQGRLDEARQAFAQAIASGGDRELNAYYLAALSESDVPAQATAIYVTRFFDEYAGAFDDHLLGTLHYRAPETLTAQLATLGARRYPSTLDLGCGTGLLGPLLRPLSDRLAGVDLSPAMLARAEALGVYDELACEEIVEHLRATETRHDLVVAADVFIYIGALAPVFAGVARVLAPGGAFAFTAEALADGSRDVALLPSLRYAHSERHLRELASAHGFALASLLRAPLRREQGRDVEGLYLILRR